MRTITLHIDGVIVRAEPAPPLIAGSVNDIFCVFDFSTDWSGLTKIAVFSAGTATRAVILDDDAPVAVPWETLRTADARHSVGVYGYRGEALVRQTTPVCLGYVQPGTDRTAAEGAEPTPTIAQQILADIGDMSELETEARDTLVDAINEAARSDGGGTGGGSYTLPVASPTRLGGIKVGEGLEMSGETLNSEAEALTNLEIEAIINSFV